MASYLSKLLEATKSIISRGSLVISDAVISGRVYPDPTYETMNGVHIGDPDIRAAIDFIADVAVGGGIQNSMNESYTTKTLAKINGEDNEFRGLTAKELVDAKCEVFGVDELLQENSRDLIGYGNSWLWTKNPVKIEILARILPGIVQGFTYDKETGLFLTGVQTQKKTYPAEELIPFSYNRIGKDPLGVGILQSLCTSMHTEKGDRPPFAEIKNRIQKAFMEQIEKFSAYNELWVLPGVSDAKLAEYSAQVKALNNQRLVFNKADAKVIQLIPERMRGLDLYAQMLWDSFYLALQTPYPKLILGGGAGFTEASANAAVNMGERRIYSLQRYEKRKWENNVFNRWISEAGLDPHLAGVRMNWQLGEKIKPDILAQLLLETWKNKGINTDEWRDFLKDYGVDLKPNFQPDGVKTT